MNYLNGQSQPAITCSKLETLEQGVKYDQNQNDAIGVVLVSLLLTLNRFRTLL